MVGNRFRAHSLPQVNRALAARLESSPGSTIHNCCVNRTGAAALRCTASSDSTQKVFVSVNESSLLACETRLCNGKFCHQIDIYRLA